MSNIEERVKKIVCEQLGVKEEDVKASSSFVDDLGADSLDTVELVMALEEEFETEIPAHNPNSSGKMGRKKIHCETTGRKGGNFSLQNMCKTCTSELFSR